MSVVVSLLESGGGVAPAEDAVVWLVGRGPGALGSDTEPRRPRIAQRKKTFEPHVEAVPVGAMVDFPNFDRIYHNVFSLSEIAKFDLGLYRKGASRSVTFTKPGVVRIYCNIHPQMTAFLVVVDSVHYGKTDVRGQVVLADVPPGRWTIEAWQERGGGAQDVVTVPTGGTVTHRFRLDASSWRLLPHKNKYGKEYPPPDDDESRY